ncbi:hypothetical protein Indivirus_1_205 [Indivirus ILV1]|uniref:Uncharacterized protein n=1 Tax=Indivirus ILV1 TaxID=1977633 RepID=A0A1V0SD00_9VIRU|nr:hypothetical protein Indivirus_1_205 [Indivirus ILV1]
MTHNCSDKCSNCKNLQRKLELYENFVKDIKTIDNNNLLKESIIIEKDNYGNSNKKLKSDLTESFLIVDKGKNLNELDKKEQDIIKEQDSYSNYQNANTYIKKANNAYTISCYVVSIGKWFLLL